MKMMVDRCDGKLKWPRRSCLDQLIPAEQAIGLAVSEIEKLPCDVRLTDIQIRLMELNDRLADWAEETGYVKPEVTP